MWIYNKMHIKLVLKPLKHIICDVRLTIHNHTVEFLFHDIYTGVGSMGAPGAGAPIKFLSGIHTK